MRQYGVEACLYFNIDKSASGGQWETDWRIDNDRQAIAAILAGTR
jgi:hypothetical protein